LEKGIGKVRTTKEAACGGWRVESRKSRLEKSIGKSAQHEDHEEYEEEPEWVVGADQRSAPMGFPFVSFVIFVVKGSCGRWARAESRRPRLEKTIVKGPNHEAHEEHEEELG